MPGEALQPPQDPQIIIEKPSADADEGQKAAYDLASFAVAAGGGEAAVHPDAPEPTQ